MDEQAIADQIYLQQVAQHDRDAALQRIVSVLQGIAAVVTIVVGIHVLMNQKG